MQGSIYFTIMADQCADVTDEEQLVICFCWVDENLEVHEDFEGLHSLNDTKADTIVKVTVDTIQRMGLKIENARGQCYELCCSVHSLLQPCTEPSSE